VAERKIPNMHLSRSMQARFKCGVKLTVKSARRARKVTERKMGNMHLLEACKATCKGGKSAKRGGKKIGNTHLLEACGDYL
jgi:hypothetical protein